MDTHQDTIFMSYYKLTLFIACLCLLCGGSQAQTKVETSMADFVTPRMRVIIDNDFSGDPDGLFQLAHHLLSPSVEIRGIIGSHLKAGAGFGSEANNSAKAACEQVNELMARLKPFLPMGEIYILGDSPLVLLTALQSGFEPDPASSHYEMRQAPAIAADGTYRYQPKGRPIRIYNRLDVRLMFADMIAKLKLAAQ